MDQSLNEAWDTMTKLCLSYENVCIYVIDLSL